MKIPVGEKNKVIEQYKLGNLDEAIKLLFVLNNKDYNDILDKHFIYKTLTILYKKIEEKKDINERDYKIAIYYSSKAFLNITKLKDEKHDQYYETMWVNIGLNENNISTDQAIIGYEDIKKYYDDINYRRNSIALQINISKLKKDYDTIVALLLEVIENENDLEYHGMESEILQDIKNIFGDTYLETTLKIVADKRNGICIA